MDKKIDSSIVGYQLAILYRYGNIYLDKRLVPFGVGAAQAKILLMLYKNESLTQVDLSKMLKLDRGNVTRSIKKLEKIGYIKRIKDERDNRVYHIILTDEGKKIKDTLFKIFYEWSNIILNDFTENDKSLLFEFLNRMINQADKYLNKK